MVEKAKQARRWWQNDKRFLLVATVALIVLLSALVLAVGRFGWDWTGFNERFGPELEPGRQYRPAKTLWDWMQLILIPMVLAAGGIWFNWSQKQREQSIADDRQKETALQTYLDQMANLILHEELRTKEKETSVEVRQVALTQTLTALQRLDGRRRAIVVRFLYDLRLIDKDDPIVDLKGVVVDGANQWFYILSNRGDAEALSMTGANLEEVDLRGVNLEKAGLGGVNLRNANLRGAYLWDAQLNGANLSGVDLRWANLGGADLRKAILHGAQVSHTNLRGSDLSETDLRGVIWGEGADLSHATLLGVKLDKDVLSKARLEHAVMEAITNYDDHSLPVFQEVTQSEDEWGRMPGPMLENAILMSCSLRGADLQNANLRHADLTDATLVDCNLSGADLRGANLDSTELCHTDLRKANLDGAKFYNVDLSEANLEGAIVSDEQLAKAKSLRAATMPDGSKH